MKTESGPRKQRQEAGTGGKKTGTGGKEGGKETGAYPGRMHVHPPSPLCIPPGHVHPPPPQPKRLVMRKDETVGNKKKMHVCLPKHNYKLDNNLLTVEPRAVDPDCFDADPDPHPAQNLDADPDPVGGWG
jgi:hypothetical protein